MYHKNYIIVIVGLLFFASKESQENGDESFKPLGVELKVWQEGYLDIHHINTGSGNSTFFVLPDGTTMLFDAGSLDKENFEKRVAPLKATSPIPDDSKTTAEWLSKYIKHVIPTERKLSIDYALISHFHSDHYGSFPALGKEIPFGKIIDRNSPNLDFPLDLSIFLKEDELFQNYLSFIAKEAIPTEALIVGSDSQIHLLNDRSRYPTFKVQNIKSNATIWTGTGNETFEYFTADKMIDFYKGRYNENPLSLAIKMSYGDFDYFTGGDNTGLQGHIVIRVKPNGSTYKVFILDESTGEIKQEFGIYHSR